MDTGGDLEQSQYQYSDRNETLWPEHQELDLAKAGIAAQMSFHCF